MMQIMFQVRVTVSLVPGGTDPAIQHYNASEAIAHKYAIRQRRGWPLLQGLHDDALLEHSNCQWLITPYSFLP